MSKDSVTSDDAAAQQAWRLMTTWQDRERALTGKRPQHYGYDRLVVAITAEFAALRADLARVTTERDAARDCGQDGGCALSPGCQRHWLERNAELVRERDEALADAGRAASDLTAAWTATGVAGTVRGLTTLADVIACTRAERDEWRDHAEARKAALNDLEQYAVTIRLLMEQRDTSRADLVAQAALVERMRGAITKYRDADEARWGHYTNATANEMAETRFAHASDELSFALSLTPADALREHDFDVKADAMDSHARFLRECHPWTPENMVRATENARDSFRAEADRIREGKVKP